MAPKAATRSFTLPGLRYSSGPNATAKMIIPEPKRVAPTPPPPPSPAPRAPMMPGSGEGGGASGALFGINPAALGGGGSVAPPAPPPAPSDPADASPQAAVADPDILKGLFPTRFNFGGPERANPDLGRGNPAMDRLLGFFKRRPAY